MGKSRQECYLHGKPSKFLIYVDNIKKGKGEK